MASFKFPCILLFIGFATLVDSTTIATDIGMGVVSHHLNNNARKSGGDFQTCNSLVGECTDNNDEVTDGGLGLDFRRSLFTYRRRPYISKAAMMRGRVPCGRRGTSYYNCKRSKRVNPYKRGCTRITYCYRYLK